MKNFATELGPVFLTAFVCAAFAQQQLPNAAGSLAGTSWQLVKFQGGDHKTLTPDDKSRYTISFAPDGGVSVRIDCNRGHGTWESDGTNRLQLSPMTLTRAMCASAPLNDRLPADWQTIRAYTIKDGHLFLSPASDAGTYEFETLTERTAQDDSKASGAPQPALSALPATFIGTLPCADCPGIRYQLNLYPDHTFSSRMIYEERNTSFDSRGQWDVAADKVLSLHDSQGSVQKYAVRDEGILRQLDASGHEIDSKLNFDLKRAPAYSPIDHSGKVATPLEQTDWNLTWLSQANIGSSPQQRVAYFVLDPSSHRVSGSGGCNRLTGSYELDGDQLKFTQMAGTMMACLQGMDTEKIFLQALGQVKTWKISGENLVLLDARGRALARFERRRQD